MRSGGKPIEYKGKILHMWDRISVPKRETEMEYRILSTSSEWKQGFGLSVNGDFDFGTEKPIKSAVSIWEDTAPHTGTFRCRSNAGPLIIKNIWDEGRGGTESGTNGAAMWIEEIPNGRRYHCNDGHFDDDFDDIVFEITLVVSGPDA